MRLYKMSSNTAAALKKYGLYQSATALQPVPPHATPLNRTKEFNREPERETTG